MRGSSFSATALALALVAASGCGGGPALVVVDGALTKGGAAYATGDNDQVMVTFFTETATPETQLRFNARANPDGSFRMAGPEGKGIPAKAYKVAVVNVPMIPDPRKPSGDRLQGAFDEAKTPLVADVGAKRSFVFDLGKR